MMNRQQVAQKVKKGAMESDAGDMSAYGRSIGAHPARPAKTARQRNPIKPDPKKPAKNPAGVKTKATGTKQPKRAPRY